MPQPKNRSAYGTYLYFVEPGTLETLMRDYRRILTDNFKKVRIEGDGEYWTCGQEHDTRNWKVETLATSRADVSKTGLG